MADFIKKEVFTVTLKYEMTVDTNTGEVLEIKLNSRSIDTSDLKPSKVTKKEHKEEPSEPKLFLEDNKYRISTSAKELMNLDETSKLVIKYEDSGSESIPVIGTNTAFGINSGNKLTKSNTVACRGNNHDELAKHGTSFTVVPHPSKKDLFVLVSDDRDSKEELKKDENVSIEEDIDTNLPFDIDMTSLADDQDADIKEIDSSFFNNLN